jgi:hypothetical protein
MFGLLLFDEQLEAELEEDGDGDSEIDLRVLRESKMLLLVSSVVALELSLEYLTKLPVDVVFKG